MTERRPDLRNRLLEAASGLHQKIANDVPQIRRGKVWCKTCRREQSVDGAECLRSGWPKCCGYTMTIDHPDTWENTNAR